MKIVMKGSSHWTTNYWKKQIRIKKTCIGIRDRKMIRPVERDLSIFYFSIPLDSEVSDAIRNKPQPFFYEFDDFSLAYQCFIIAFCKHLLGSYLERMGFGMEFYSLRFEKKTILFHKTKDKVSEKNQGFNRFFLPKSNLMIEMIQLIIITKSIL